MRHLMFVTVFFLLAACASTASLRSSRDPTQLAARQIEVRELEVPYDIAYRAATQAMFSLGYNIDHSDKTSGILTGSRMAGVQAAKEQIKRKEAIANAGYVLGWIPFVGPAGGLATLGAHLMPTKEPQSLQITIYLQPKGEKRTEIRFKMLVDGEPAWEPAVIDQLWVTTQREAMIETGSSS